MAFPAGTLVSGVGGRFPTIVGLHPEVFDAASILDIGARDGLLGNYVPSNGAVVSLDVTVGQGVGLIADLERGLPFPAQSFDTVVALDVLEHLDRLAFGFGEVLRVARAHAVVALPNLYEFASRFRYLAGRPLSGKYCLTDQAAEGGDRHRWVFTPDHAAKFVSRKAKALGFDVFDLRYLTLGYGSVPMRVVQALVERLQVGRNLFGGTMVFYLRRTAEARPSASR